MYYNYSISESKGQFYEKSKDPKEGFEKVIYGTDNKVTYHKYTPRVQGRLEKVEIKSFPEKKLTFLDVTLKDGENNISISTQLKRLNGNFNDNVTRLVSCLTGADFGENIVLSCKKNGNYLNIYCNYVDRRDADGKGISTGYIPNTDIPRADKSKDPLTGQDTYKWEKVTEYWQGKLQELLKRSEEFSSKKEPVSVPESSAAILSDDLPF